MEIRSFLLFPFRKLFSPISIEAKIGYLTIPSNRIVSIFLFIYFIFCVSGAFYCIVNSTPIGGYSISEMREVVVSFIQLNTFDAQFTLELYTTMIFGSLFALSFFCMYKTGKDEEKNWKLSIIYKIGACSSIIWIIILLSFMKEKSSGYSYLFNPVFSHKKARYYKPK